MRHKLISLIIGPITAMAMSTAAVAQMGLPPGPPPPGPPSPVAMMLAGISLTAEQQSTIAAIMKSHQTAVAPLMDQLHTEHQQLIGQLLSSGPVTLADLTPLEQQSAQTEQQLHQEMLKAALEVRALLTPDQLATAAQNQKKLDQLRGEIRLIMGSPPGAP